jgi:hypothetical protein
MHILTNEFRYAARQLYHSPGFTVAGIVRMNMRLLLVTGG